MKYSWCLGIKSKNQVEVLVVCMGMKLLKEDKSSSVIIIKDLKLIIKVLRKLSKNSQLSLQRIYNKIKIEKKIFQSVDFFHVFQRKNGEADILAKNAKQMDQGII
jgi:ribonuclease HI